MIELFRHNIEQEAIDLCVEVLKSNWHTAGPINKRVEEAIRNYYDGYYVTLTSSCTSGLIAVAMAWDLKEGDEVITTPITFTATAASVMNRGAQPVFVDIDPNTGLIDVDLIESKITPKTKAIFIVNLYGHVPSIKKIRSIADKYNLFLLEDCAHAFDSIHDGCRPATWSHAACYSFYATKNLACGEGGAVISKDPDLIKRVKAITRHGLSKWPQPGMPGNMDYDVVDLGFKGTLSDIQASLLLDQIHKTDFNRNARQLISERYFNRFSKLKNVKCVMPPEGTRSSWYTFPILVKHRKSLIETLQSAKIGHTIMYRSLEELSLYNTGEITCPIALEYSHKQLSLPCYSQLTVGELEKIIRTVEKWDFKCS